METRAEPSFDYALLDSRLQAVIEQLKKEGYPVREEDIVHLSPARHEHINFYGKYFFNVAEALERKGLGGVLWNRRRARYRRHGPSLSALPQTTHARFPCTWLSRSSSTFLRLDNVPLWHLCISHALRLASVDPPALRHVLDLLQLRLLWQFRPHEALALEGIPRFVSMRRSSIP